MDGEWSARALVFVSLGTDHHPFPRLVAMVATWARQNPSVDVLVQIGHTEPEVTTDLDVVGFMGPAALESALTRASVVVCHGGPSTIMEARAAGHDPIVVARDPDLGEHVDDHQLRFVDRLDRAGHVVAVQTTAALVAAVDRAVEAGRSTHDREERPEASAAVARIGDLLDGLIATKQRTDRRGRVK